MIYIDGKQVNNIPASKREIGFVFQNYALFRYKTVYENIAFGLKIQKKSKAEIKNRVEELIELVGLKGLEKRYPKTAFRRTAAEGCICESFGNAAASSSA